MDILISSNLERLLFEFAGRDGDRVREWMSELQASGSYDVGGETLCEIRETFFGGYAPQNEYAETLGEVYDEYGYLCDPHTAVAFHVLGQYLAACESSAPAVVVSTASPVKFASTVLESIGETAPADDVKALEKMEKITAFPVPDSVYKLFELPERFGSVISPNEVNAAVEAFAASLNKTK